MGSSLACRRGADALPAPRNIWSAADNPVIAPGSQSKDESVDDYKNQEGSDTAANKQRDIGKVQQSQQLCHHLKSSDDMDSSCGQRKIEDSEHLASDGRSDFTAAHAHFLHDDKPFSVIIAL